MAHIWTMVSQLLQSELEEGLGPLIMVKYLEFSLNLSRVEIAFAEVISSEWCPCLIVGSSVGENMHIIEYLCW